MSNKKTSIVKKIAMALLVLFAAIMVLFFAMSLLAKRPTNLGVQDGKFQACPGTPNCVSSQSTDEQSRIAPLTFSGTDREAMERLVSVLKSMPRTSLITVEDRYLHVEFTSLVFRYVDDMEFCIANNGKIIDVRSASRAGQYDLGANRKRIEDIRKQFMKSQSQK